jgi:Alternative complex III, ActD subunit
MANKLTLLALFTDVEPAVQAIDRLREMGIEDQQMDIISGLPLSPEILGRPKIQSFIPKLALGGAIVGFIAAMFLMFGIPFLFSLHVGGQPLYPIPPFYIVAFELTMLGLMGTAFVGLFLAGRFPTYEPKIYIPEISDGKIAITFPCSEGDKEQFADALSNLGAEQVKPVEAKTL